MDFYKYKAKQFRIGIEALVCINEYSIHLPFFTATVRTKEGVNMSFYRIVCKVQDALSFRIGKIKFECELGAWYIGVENYRFSGINIRLPFYRITK